MSRLDLAIFNALITQRPADERYNIFCLEDPSLFHAYHITRLQSPLAAKNLLLAKETARYILADNGEIDQTKIVKAIDYLSKTLYPLGPDRQDEAKPREHLLNMLHALKKNPSLKESIKKLFVPSYKTIQDLIQHTLALPPNTTLTPFHTKHAALTALFSYLRQDVGSCFASAFAILIHQEHPERFLKDIEALLSTGRMTRTIGAQEITVPMNLSGCIGELFKPIPILDLYPHPLTTLALSPGLQRAFQATQIISIHNATEELEKCLSHEYLIQTLQHSEDTITANQIIESTLQHHYQVSQDHIQQLLHTEGLYTQEILSTTTEQKVRHYLSAYETAKHAFISETQNPLLKSWEYTLASLSDVNSSLALEHILIALGWKSEEPESFPHIILNFIQNAIQETQKDSEKYEHAYNEAQSQLLYVESRMRNPLNDQDNKILIADHIRIRQELNQHLQEWNTAQEKAKKLSALPNFLLSFYSQALPQYFRSTYDAFIQEFAHLYTDTPAGFRLVFTHGRSHPHTWSPIHSLHEFITALSDFFSSTEYDLMNKHNIQKVEKETQALLSSLISSLHRPSFQEAALLRILHAYQAPIPSSPLNHLEQLSHTPWVYISGGHVHTLIQNYFELPHPPAQIEKRTDNAHELAAFLSDALKDLPSAIKNYLENNTHSLLASSPTHVFSITAGSPLFLDAWNNDWYSYTWLRDVWMEKQKKFLAHTLLNEQTLFICLERFCKKNNLEHLTRDFQDFCSDLSLSLPEFYHKASRFLEKALPQTASPFYQQRLVSHIVREAPYISEQQISEVLDMISNYLGISSRITYEKVQSRLEEFIPKLSLLSSEELRHLLQGLLMESYQRVYFEEDMLFRLTTAMRHHHLSYPAPLLFGDTNWAYRYFGFILHPGTQAIDMWTFNYMGLYGRPLEEASQQMTIEHPWRLYPHPTDYGMIPPPGYRYDMPRGMHP